jgi:hypothetical protein
MGRKKASDFPEELLNLTAPPFFGLCPRFALGGRTAAALFQLLGRGCPEWQ